MKASTLGKIATVAGALLALSASARAEEKPLAPLRDRVVFGSYAKGLPYFNKEFKKLESPAVLGQRVEIVSGFVDWDYVLGEPRDVALAEGGRPLLYSWEPHCIPRECISFRSILEGKKDEYFERIAESMKRFPSVIYVRPWAEMNAHWSPYLPGSKAPSAGTKEEFKQAWRYVYSFFRKRGVSNLRFVFNPDEGMTEEDVPVEEIWPGAEFVDVLGIDGYNWGNAGTPHGNKWREFDEVFEKSYDVLTKLHPTAPVWICEFGSKEPRKADGTKESPAPVDRTNDKAKWIDNMMTSTRYPRIEALLYYNTYTPGKNNQRDFRFESSKGALEAIRRQLKARKKGDERG